MYKCGNLESESTTHCCNHQLVVCNFVCVALQFASVFNTLRQIPSAHVGWSVRVFYRSTFSSRSRITDSIRIMINDMHPYQHNFLPNNSVKKISSKLISRVHCSLLVTAFLAYRLFVKTEMSIIPRKLN